MDCITNPLDTAACKAYADNPLILQLAAPGRSGEHPSAANASGEKQNMAQATVQEVKAGTVPALTIEQGPTPASAPMPAATASASHHWYDGALAVTEDVAVGAWDEVTEHPLRVAESFAIGAATAAIASVVATPVAIGATVLGLGYGAYQVYKHAPDWLHSAEDVANPEGHSQAEMARAHQTLQGFGGGATDLVAAIGGGIAYRAASSAISAALDDVDAHPVKAAAVNSATTNDGGSSGQAQAATPTDGGGASQTVPPATPTDGGGASSQAAPTAAPTDGVGSSAHGAVVPGHDGSLAHHALAAGQTENGEAPVTGDGAAEGSGESSLGGEAKPIEVAATADLANPQANTSEAALREAFKEAIAASKEDGTPITFKVDTTVPLTDAAGNPIKLTQADVLYQELQAATPENHFVFSKPNLSPGDAGYTEFPAPSVVQDGLQISTKENAITLAKGTILPDGTTLPDGSKFAVGTTYDGDVVKSALPGGKVWAIKPDGSYVQVADAGQSTPIASDAISTDPKLFGQVVNAQTDDGFQNHIIIRTDAKAVAPDGQPLLDAYPSGGPGFDNAFKEGTEPGLYAPKPKLADHFKLPTNVTIEANTSYGASTASGAKGDYFMKSGFADAQDATAKNYSGPAKDAQSIAELLRIRIAQGLHSLTHS
jgi:hypothetical protein